MPDLKLLQQLQKLILEQIWRLKTKVGIREYIRKSATLRILQSVSPI
jgi:hypothetical protein